MRQLTIKQKLFLLGVFGGINAAVLIWLVVTGDFFSAVMATLFAAPTILVRF